MNHPSSRYLCLVLSVLWLSACAGGASSVARNYSFPSGAEKGLMVMTLESSSNTVQVEVELRRIADLSSVATIKSPFTVLEMAPGGYEFYGLKIKDSKGKHPGQIRPSKKFVITAGKATYVGNFRLESTDGVNFYLRVVENSRMDMRRFQDDYKNIRYSQIQVGLAR